VYILPDKAIPEMTYTVPGGTLNPTHSLTPTDFRNLLGLQSTKPYHHIKEADHVGAE